MIIAYLYPCRSVITIYKVSPILKRPFHHQYIFCKFSFAILIFRVAKEYID